MAEQANSRLNAIQRPSNLGTGLQIVGAAAGAYGTYAGNQAAIKRAQTAGTTSKYK